MPLASAVRLALRSGRMPGRRLSGVAAPASAASAAGLDVVRARSETPGTRAIAHFNNAGAALCPAAVTKAQVDHIELEAALGGYEAAALRQPEIDAVWVPLVLPRCFARALSSYTRARSRSTATATKNRVLTSAFRSGPVPLFIARRFLQRAALLAGTPRSPRSSTLMAQTRLPSSRTPR